MLFDDYQRDAARTINSLGHPHDLINHTLGLAGESGEVVEMIKKHLYHGKELDQQRLAEELGDVLWYVAAVCSSAGLSLGDVAQDNITKLRDRYPEGFASRHISSE